MGNHIIEHISEEQEKGLWNRLKARLTSKPKSSKVPPNDCSCYVLITCTKPTKDGDMEVEMTYEGDESLVSYLVENAQVFFNKEGSQ